MTKVSKKKHKDKDDVTWYRHPVYIWLWFAEIDNKFCCKTSKIIPPYSNRPTITDTPQIEIRGTLDSLTKQRIIITRHKSIEYRLTFEEGYEEAKLFKSKKELEQKKIREPIKFKNREDFITSILTFTTNQATDPPREEGYELFDFPLPISNQLESKIDYSKIKQLESGIWTIITKKGYLGGYDSPFDAYQEYLRLRGIK